MWVDLTTPRLMVEFDLGETWGAPRLLSIPLYGQDGMNWIVDI